MASETEASDSLLTADRDLSLFLPLILGFASTEASSSADPVQEMENPLGETPVFRDRIIFINPFTQGMVVIEGSFSNLDSMMRDLLSLDDQPPASKSSIEAMPSVKIGEGEEEGACVVCLEEWEADLSVKEMPCKHRFHGKCIEKWLVIHGSCPVCRYKMPVEDEELTKKSIGPGGEVVGMRREIWVSFSFSGDRGSEDTDSIASQDQINSSSPTGPDHEIEN